MTPEEVIVELLRIGWSVVISRYTDDDSVYHLEVTLHEPSGIAYDCHKAEIFWIGAIEISLEPKEYPTVIIDILDLDPRPYGSTTLEVMRS